MYSQPWEKGVKLAFPSRIIRKWLKEVRNVKIIEKTNHSNFEKTVELEKNQARLVAVAYSNKYSQDDKNLVPKITWSSVSNTNKGLLDFKKVTGYVKDMAWSYEKEIRIFVEFLDEVSYYKVAIPFTDGVLNSMSITASPLFKGDLVAKIQQLGLEGDIQFEDSLFKGKLNHHSICERCEYKNHIISTP